MLSQKVAPDLKASDESVRLQEVKLSDYISKYIDGNYFDITSLINDDFVITMKLLWNAKHYNSNLKLLLSFIDTMAFVSTGKSNPNSFKGWLKKYVHLNKIGITEDELWEHRNAILHLSTYESNKVRNGNIRKLVPYAGQNSPPESKNHCYYSLYELQMEIFQAIGRYLTEMEKNDKMREIFCDNYEKTVSDTHFTHHV